MYRVNIFEMNKILKISEFLSKFDSNKTETIK